MPNGLAYGRKSFLKEFFTCSQNGLVILGGLVASKNRMDLLQDQRLAEMPTMTEKLLRSLAPVVLAELDHSLDRRGVNKVGKSDVLIVEDIANLGKAKTLGCCSVSAGGLRRVTHAFTGGGVGRGVGSFLRTPPHRVGLEVAFTIRVQEDDGDIPPSAGKAGSRHASPPAP